jgi:hypothetical protein
MFFFFVDYFLTIYNSNTCRETAIDKREWNVSQQSDRSQMISRRLNLKTAQSWALRIGATNSNFLKKIHTSKMDSDLVLKMYCRIMCLHALLMSHLNVLYIVSSSMIHSTYFIIVCQIKMNIWAKSLLLKIETYIPQAWRTFP